jgi:hypothetical protein
MLIFGAIRAELLHYMIYSLAEYGICTNAAMHLCLRSTHKYMYASLMYVGTCALRLVSKLRIYVEAIPGACVSVVLRFNRPLGPLSVTSSANRRSIHFSVTRFYTRTTCTFSLHTTKL